MKDIVRAAVAVALGLAVAAAPASAQKKALVWNAGVELGFPGTGATTGFGVRVGATLTPTGWPVWLRPEASFDHFGIDCSGCGGITQIGVGADAGYDFKSTSTLKPYALAGLSITHSSWSNSFVPGVSVSGTGLGFDIGGGARLPLGSMKGYGELRYHTVGGTGGVDYFALTVGLLFGSH